MTDSQPERDALSGVETTGHVWDGIRELNNPAPRWWLIIFLLTVVWALGYWVVYPAVIVPRGQTSGLLAWSSAQQLRESQAQITARRQAQVKDFAALPLDTIRATPAYYQFARAGGQALFKENCAPCHGSGAAGRKGYPNLNDDDWLWGGQLSDVYTTIKHGVRAKDDATRANLMPSFGADGILKPDEIEAVAYHVETLSGRRVKASPAVLALGARLFVENCAACHGAGGQGNSQLGAPRLTDAIWLYGGAHEDIVAQVDKPRQGVMPSWSQRLPDASIKQLAIYIDSLGGVQRAGGPR